MLICIPDISILCIGSVKDRHNNALIERYLRRLRHEARCELREFKDQGRNDENRRIISALDKMSGYSFALTAGLCRSVAALDVVELNPEFDRDEATARLAARTVWEFSRGLSQRPTKKQGGSRFAHRDE